MKAISAKRLCAAFIVLLLVAGAVLAAVCSGGAGEADAASLRQGSTGDKVSEMQRKLKNWGYYDGAVDGIVGSGTREAVIYFQRVNGLGADGELDPLVRLAVAVGADMYPDDLGG